MKIEINVKVSEVNPLELNQVRKNLQSSIIELCKEGKTSYDDFLKNELSSYYPRIDDIEIPDFKIRIIRGKVFCWHSSKAFNEMKPEDFNDYSLSSLKAMELAIREGFAAERAAIIAAAAK